MYLFFDEAPLLGWLIDTNTLIIAIAIGIFLAFFAYWFTQTVVGSLVRKLLSKGVGEDNAMTLDQLSKNSFVFRFLLRDDSVLRKTVSCVGGALPVIEEEKNEEEANESKTEEPSKSEDESEKEPVATIVESEKEEKKSFFARFKKPKKDFSKAKFFIAEENMEKAKAKYPRSIKGAWLVLVFFLCVAIGIGMMYLIPFIMDLILK